MSKNTATNWQFIKRPIIIVLIGTICLGLILAILEKTSVINLYKNDIVEPPPITSDQSQPNGEDPSSKIDYSPARPSDNTATEKMKETDPVSQPSPISNQEATIILNQAKDLGSSVELKATINGIKSGTCVGHIVSKSSSGSESTSTASVTYQDTSNTYICKNLVVPKEQLTSNDLVAYVTIQYGSNIIKSNLWNL